MKLSIIIPVYCVENTLERCVRSIVDQNYNDIEIILVDDGSTDNSPQLCDKWLIQDKRVRVIHKNNGGLSDARNAGIEKATGDYITFVDSDDFIRLDTYPALMERLKNHPNIDILEFPFYWHFGAKEQKIINLGEQEYEDASAYWLKGNAYEHSYAWNKIYRRELFKDVRFPKGRIFEDIATLPHLLKKCKSIVTTDQGLYYYCYNEQGITSTAKGPGLKMLLENHLQVSNNREWFTDTRYYMHVLNIQMDVYELTDARPLLPRIKVNPFAKNLTKRDRIKAFLLNIIGISRLCKINKTLHKFRSNHS